MKTLVVEPSKTYRLLLNEFLHGFAINPQEVIDGTSAIANMSKNQYELICIAMYLPDMLGVDLAKQIKEIKGFEHCIIIIFSSEQSQEKLALAKTDQVNYICQKMALDKLKSLFAHITQDELVTYDGTGHILYIEDHQTQAKLTLAMLTEMGLTADHFTSAEAGLDALERNDYDLILLDIVLEGKKDGIDFIEDTRERTDEKRVTPVLAISASLNDSQRIHALKVGASDFINKPFIQAELAARLKNMLLTQQLYQQVSAQKQALEKMAMTDQLTNLFNRHFLMPYIKKALSSAQRYGYPLSIVMIDLDKFKLINDDLGHSAGDKLLCDIANILNANCRSEDAAIRLGGDEFLLVLPHCSLEQAKFKTATLRQAIIELPPASHQTSASFGLSSTEADSFDFETLFSQADAAVYQAKENGGNDICY
ncbi:MAG: diguanylate cyclase [Colwellia sp.]|nr:diguanylate cyclase [Colwellia sp.]